MSKLNNDESNNISISTKGSKWIAIIGVIVVVILGVYAYKVSTRPVDDTSSLENSENSGESLADNSELQSMDSVIEADTSNSMLVFDNVELSSTLDADTAKQLQILQEDIDKAYNNNALLFLIMGEEDTDRVAQIYNKDYQSYTEYATNATEIAYERGNSIQITNQILRMKNLTALDTLQGVLNLAKSGIDGVHVEVFTEDIHENDFNDITTITDETTESTENIDDGESTDNTEVSESVENTEVSESSDSVEETEKDRGAYLYTQTRTTVTIDKSAFDNYYDCFGDYSANMSKEVWDSIATDEDENNEKLIYDFLTTNVDDTFSAGEYIVIDGEEYISWYFDNYYSLDDWTLDKEEWKESHTVQEFIDITKNFQDSTISKLVASKQKETDEKLSEIESDVSVEETEEIQETETSELEESKNE